MAISGEEKIIIFAVVGFIGWSLLRPKDIGLAQEDEQAKRDSELRSLDLRLSAYKKSFTRLVSRLETGPEKGQAKTTRTDFEDLLQDVADIRDDRERLGGSSARFLATAIS